MLQHQPDGVFHLPQLNKYLNRSDDRSNRKRRDSWACVERGASALVKSCGAMAIAFFAKPRSCCMRNPRDKSKSGDSIERRNKLGLVGVEAELQR